ncbi:glucose-fructose oxidoreductase [Niabella ginsenosidivorans]|uniref:Glucose-fructose oxidoreductase n=1 Tax=Niabella ginsenosidivorans TaxID=1176587 RepID=A0A1A9HZN6_9BACT|nr:Gfo/Idh/MocA family oxidoreductase [Niabella ginsenosidivorans]ANH80877.1 glucose-fructose oxidoreductase [Niabella ginsenosidivorans]
MHTRRKFIREMSLSALGLYTVNNWPATASPFSVVNNEGPVLKVALMGLGGYATRVAEAMQQCKRAKITGLVSGTPEKLKSWGEKYAVPEKNRYNYENADAIKNNPDIDAVYVITPNALHHDLVIRMAGAGKHVICEKPMGLNAREGKEMVAACKKAGKKLLVGYRMHFEPATLEVIRMRNAGEFGTLRFFQGLCGFRIGDPTQWRLNKALAGGGALMDIGIYALNGARYMVGEEPVWVTAQETKTDPVKFKEGVDETITFQLGFPGGIMASCLSTYNMNNLDRFFLDGDNGFAELQPAAGYGPVKGRTHKGPLQVQATLPQQTIQMDAMAAILLDGTDPVVPVDGEEAVRDLVIIDAIYQAAKTGEKIKLG